MSIKWGTKDVIAAFDAAMKGNGQQQTSSFTRLPPESLKRPKGIAAKTQPQPEVLPQSIQGNTNQGMV
jgi:hypothetical protein